MSDYIGELYQITNETLLNCDEKKFDVYMNDGGGWDNIIEFLQNGYDEFIENGEYEELEENK